MKQKAVGVFISYSSEDRLVATLLADKIREMGYQAWIDFAGLRGGDEWRSRIDDALGESVAVLVLLTPDATSSQWVHYEIKRAKENNHPIIPLMVRTCTIPPSLEHLHYVDFRNRMGQAYVELGQALVQAVLRRSETYSAINDTDHNREKFAQEIERLRPAEAMVSTGETAEVPRQGAGILKPLALVIEDEEPMQRLLKETLVDFGLEVHIAATRNEATDLMRKHVYQFITLDMVLGPDDIEKQTVQEGLITLDMLERYQTGVPTVMISTFPFDGPQVREFLVKRGVKDVLKKPFSSKDLYALVKRYVSTEVE